MEKTQAHNWFEIGRDLICCYQQKAHSANHKYRKLVISKTNGLIFDKIFSEQHYGQKCSSEINRLRKSGHINNIEALPDWWRSMFDEIYLLTDARSVCDDALACREVDIICELIAMQPTNKILDLCGGYGRHSHELYQRGFKSCVVLDYSEFLINKGQAISIKRDYLYDFIRCDARQTALKTEVFDIVLLLGSSLGYNIDPEEDKKILKEAFHVLRPNGWFLLDVSDGIVMKKSFSPNSWHEIGEETVVCRHRELRGNMINARELVIDKRKGLIRDQTYAIRLFDSESLDVLLQQSGFSKIKIHTNFSPHSSDGDYGFMNHRMIGVGQKT